MATLSELVAAVVVHSSAAAYSHFGVTLEPVQIERPVTVERAVATERTVARTPRQALKAADCPVQPVQLRGRNIKA